MEKSANKKITLWEGYEVEVNEQLLDDFDFVQDLAEAQKNDDLPALVSMYFAILGGEEVYNAARKHIEAEKGYFSQSSLLEIIEKVNAVFPKAGSRAERRSWKTSR